MILWPRTITDLSANVALVRRARYGVIECVEGEFRSLRLRCWPTVVASDEVRLWGPLRRRFDGRDRCRLFYNQPLGHGSFLALSYALSGRACRLATLVRALTALDEIAAIKRSDAIVMHAWNPRLTARNLARYGWAPHTADPRGRHFVKRFYGEYPTPTSGENRERQDASGRSYDEQRHAVTADNGGAEQRGRVYYFWLPAITRGKP